MYVCYLSVHVATSGANIDAYWIELNVKIVFIMWYRNVKNQLSMNIDK